MNTITRTTITYATLPSALPKASRGAFSVNGDVTVLDLSGLDLTLEATTLIRAVATTEGPIRVDVTPDLARALGSSTLRQVNNLSSMLTRRDHVLVTRAQDPILVELLASTAPAPAWELSDDDASWVDANDATVVYTDGSGAPTGLGLSAWAWYVDDTTHDSGVVTHPTDSFGAERHALAQALASNSGPLLVLSDCEGVLSGTDAVLTALGVGDPLAGLVAGRTVRVSHVKGHADCLGNIQADRLAGAARMKAVAAMAREESSSELAAFEAETDALRTALEPHREESRTRTAWCKLRYREIVDAHYPQWRQLPDSERQRLRPVLFAQATREFHALRAA